MIPHAVYEDTWDPDLLRRVAQEFPPGSDARWRRYDNAHERKLGGDSHMWGPATRELMAQLRDDNWVQQLSDEFGIIGLTPDPEGGGMHRIDPGGFLDLHVDFNKSESGLWRRLNCLVFLNENWTEADGGTLHLYDNGEPWLAWLPTFNRTVVFETSDHSYHGHPEPLPGPRPRLSVACYYFTEEPPPGVSPPHTTSWLNP